MKKKLDELLRNALGPTEEPDAGLNRRIVERLEKRQKGNSLEITGQVCGSGQRGEQMEKKSLRTSAAAAAAALIIGAGSLTVAAAFKYLAPDTVAQEAGETGLAEVFEEGKGIIVNETQVYGGYRVTMLGMVSGADVSEKFRKKDNSILEDRTYAVVAVEHADGTAMTDCAEGGEEFFVSPLIEGYHPAFYNAVSMHGNYTEFVSGGVLYRLVECDNVEIFADRELYLCVSEGSVFYDSDAYSYSTDTGKISRNQEYQSLNALFRLPVDVSKADREKAEAYIENLGIEVKDRPEEKMNVDLGDGFVVETEEGTDKGASAAEYALEFLGNPYVWGGESLTEGCDSSGFTKSVYACFDIDLPHSSSEQKKYGEEIQGLENARPGDLLFYAGPSHVAIYIGEGKIVHSDPSYDICVSEADYDEIVMIRRIF